MGLRDTETCKTDGCEQPYYVRGFCAYHYRQYYEKFKRGRTCWQFSTPVRVGRHRKSNFGNRYSRIRSVAKDRGLEWNLCPGAVYALLVQSCEYCGEPGPGGIDRIDSTKGYVEGNTAPCCAGCNAAKGTLNREEFLAWIKQVVAHSLP